MYEIFIFLLLYPDMMSAEQRAAGFGEEQGRAPWRDRFMQTHSGLEEGAQGKVAAAGWLEQESLQEKLDEESWRSNCSASHRRAQRRSPRRGWGDCLNRMGWVCPASRPYLSPMALTPRRGGDLLPDVHPHVGKAIAGMRKEPLFQETDLTVPLHLGP